ncbi:hypothetical protein [Pseudobutyrivibrio sp.]|uniref:hypothetical protein n=1 Tax=Pseudobutyrivibrio sp. TaxID=2014367 RepID=UPI001E135A1D|nr:hypothetical protein [Pseudobutyrivibrio sp.]MBE5911507.1 hypothetical protein [Pseudobutyrivibrio sp.]
MMSVKKLFGLILMMVMAVTVMMPLTAKAESYTYRINIVLGGTAETKAEFLNDLSSSLTVVSNTASVSFNGADCITISDLMYEDSVAFDPKSAVAITGENAKYYVKGMRVSGANDVVSKSAFTVTQDDSYVIAYGVGSSVPYTVKYLDNAGNSLLETATYYGALGEEVYVPYRFISGYTPNAYNLHVDKLAENQEFIFTYTKAAGGNTVYNTSTSTSYSTVQGAPSYTYQSVARDLGTINNRDQQAGGNQAGGGNQGGEAAAAGEGEQAGGDATTIDDTETPLGVEDVIDIKDEEVAKAVATNALLDSYKKYAFVILIIGIAVIFITVLASAKEKYDNKKNS